MEQGGLEPPLPDFQSGALTISATAPNLAVSFYEPSAIL